MSSEYKFRFIPTITIDEPISKRDNAICLMIFLIAEAQKQAKFGVPMTGDETVLIVPSINAEPIDIPQTVINKLLKVFVGLGGASSFITHDQAKRRALNLTVKCCQFKQESDSEDECADCELLRRVRKTVRETKEFTERRIGSM